MNYALIRKHDIANGVGVRVSLFVSGCRHHCKGCFNTETWDFHYGTPFTDETIREILDACDHDDIEGLSLLGGEPFEPENQGALLALAEAFDSRFPEKTVWCYTGFSFENELLAGKIGDPDTVRALLSHIDVLVDGKFVEALKDASLLFRGSANQNIIDVKRSLVCGRMVPLAGTWRRMMGSGDIYEGEK